MLSIRYQILLGDVESKRQMIRLPKDRVQIVTSIELTSSRQGSGVGQQGSAVGQHSDAGQGSGPADVGQGSGLTLVKGDVGQGADVSRSAAGGLTLDVLESFYYRIGL